MTKKKEKNTNFYPFGLDWFERGQTKPNEPGQIQICSKQGLNSYYCLVRGRESHYILIKD